MMFIASLPDLILGLGLGVQYQTYRIDWCHRRVVIVEHLAAVPPKFRRHQDLVAAEGRLRQIELGELGAAAAPTTFSDHEHKSFLADFHDGISEANIERAAVRLEEHFAGERRLSAQDSIGANAQIAVRGRWEDKTAVACTLCGAENFDRTRRLHISAEAFLYAPSQRCDVQWRILAHSFSHPVVNACSHSRGKCAPRIKTSRTVC